jgi:UDP-glucose 4-epimerase
MNLDKRLNIIVTGGSGFIGKHLVSSLRSMNHNVINLDSIDGNDVIDYDVLNRIEEDIDVIYHLAAQPYGRGGELDPHLDLKLNTQAILNVNLFAESRNVSKVIYTSTMAVYGDNADSKETDDVNPLSNYAVSKLFGEYSLKKFARNTSIDYTIFRVWNTYGPGQDLKNEYKGLVQAMCRQCVNGTDINVTGSLERYRDLVYVDDSINALLLGLEDSTNNETYNLSTGVKITVKQLIDTIIEVLNTGKEYNVKNVGEHKGDQFGCVGNSDKLQKLGWSPKTKLSDGLKNFINYIKESDEYSISK